jgi:ABC-2 type transport system ATP-binding protein
MIIAHGDLVASDTPENLAKMMQGENTLELTLKTTEDTARYLLSQIEEISEKSFEKQEDGTVKVGLKTVGDADIREKLFYLCAEQKCPILRMENTHVSLEDIFLELTSQEKKPDVEEQPQEEVKEEEAAE